MRRPLAALSSSGVCAVALLLLAACSNESTGPVRAGSVLVSPDSISLTVGEGRQLAASVRDAKGVELTDRTVVWSTGDGAMASVSASGRVTARAVGRVVVTATSDGRVGEAVIRVEQIPIAFLHLQSDSAWTAVGNSIILVATARAEGGAVLSGRSVTWTSSDPATASVSDAGSVLAKAPGWVTIVATSEGKSDSTVVGITALPDLSIVDANVTQGVQAPDGSIPMVLGGNAAVVNVLVRSNVPRGENLRLLLRIFDAAGSLVRTDTVTRYTVIDERVGYDAPEAQFLIPASVLAAGHRWQVVRDPTGAAPDDSTVNDVFPREGTAPLATVTVPPLDIRFVPIVLSAHAGETGVVRPDMLPEYLRVVRSVHPLATINATIGDPFVTYTSFGSPPTGGAATFWTQVLSELDMARVASDAPNAHWYGVVRPPAGFNYTSYGGFAYVPASAASPRPTALGVHIGWFTDEAHARELVAHELGHNFGRRHAPCGNPSSPDPYFPIPGGLLGNPQHDVFAWATGRATSATMIPASTGDIMGYCDQPWASVYTYRGVLAFRGPTVMAAAAFAPAERTSVLVVRGAVEQGRAVSLSPAFVLEGNPTRPSAGGSYRAEGRSADGGVLFSYAFEPTELDHAPTVRHFLLAIPTTPQMEESLAELTVRGPAGVASLSRTSGTARRPGIAAAIVQRPLATGGAAYSCADTGARGIVVLDATTGALRAVGHGATVRLSAPSGTRLSVLCTDGVRTARTSVIAP